MKRKFRTFHFEKNRRNMRTNDGWTSSNFLRLRNSCSNLSKKWLIFSLSVFLSSLFKNASYAVRMFWLFVELLTFKVPDCVLRAFLLNGVRVNRIYAFVYLLIRRCVLNAIKGYEAILSKQIIWKIPSNRWKSFANHRCPTFWAKSEISLSAAASGPREVICVLSMAVCSSARREPVCPNASECEVICGMN